jgi:DNA-binding NarL/FixJ family response regulator
MSAPGRHLDGPGRLQDLRGAHVRAVDDTDINLQVVQEILEDAGLQVFTAADGAQALAMVRTWGPASMVLLAAFPDSPRTSIAALALSGVAPVLICLMVFLGKLILYAALLGLMHYLPSRLGQGRNAEATWKRWLQRRASRFVAYCRRIRWLARHPDQRSSPS